MEMIVSTVKYSLRMVAHNQTCRGHAFVLLLVLAATGCGIGTGYQKIDGEWCYVTSDEGRGRLVHEIDAHDETFVVLRGAHYAKDEESVFFGTDRIESADSSSFDVIPTEGNDYVFASDQQRVYLDGIEIHGAHPDEFEHIGGPYSKDRSHVFCGTVAMEVSNIDRFEVILWKNMWLTISDAEYFARWYGEPFANVRVPAVIGRAWSRDGESYFYGPARINGADYGSFQVTDDYTARDKDTEFSGAFSVDDWAKRRMEFTRTSTIQ